MTSRRLRIGIFLLALIGGASLIGVRVFGRHRGEATPTAPVVVGSSLPPAEPTPTASPSATPTPRPLTFSEMSERYGPCAVVPTLMYHHIQDSATATAQGHRWLAVDPAVFRSQMEYLKNHGYTVISMSSVIDFFNQGVALPPKSALVTIDDAYDDAAQAFSVLSELGMPATVFTPTGLLDNPGYLTWDQVLSAPSLIEFANHTWSHHNAFATEAVMQDEIGRADSQLTSRGLDNPKVFAYPYGPSTRAAEAVLSQFGYQLAFTTAHGSTLCARKRFDLPRIRIGNAPLSSYGL